MPTTANDMRWLLSLIEGQQAIEVETTVLMREGIAALLTALAAYEATRGEA